MINRLTAETFSKNLGNYGAARQSNLGRQESARQFDKGQAMQNLLSMRGDKTSRYMQQEGFGQDTAMARYAARVAAERLAKELGWDREKTAAYISSQEKIADQQMKMQLATGIMGAGANIATLGIGGWG